MVQSNNALGRTKQVQQVVGMDLRIAAHVGDVPFFPADRQDRDPVFLPQRRLCNRSTHDLTATKGDR